MPYKKTYKKKSYKKRGYGKKFMRRSNKKKYDGAVFQKIHLTGDIPYNTTFGHADFTVNWCGDAYTGLNTSVYVQMANEYTSLSGLYNEYKVFGVKV